MRTQKEPSLLCHGAEFEAASWREVARVAYPYPNYQLWRIFARFLHL